MTLSDLTDYLTNHPELIAMGLTAVVNAILAVKKPSGKLGQAVAEAFGGVGTEPLRLIAAVKAIIAVFHPPAEDPPPPPPAPAPEVK